MANNSPIEWTDATWNPITGCTKISPGCKHCYAERMSNRLQAMGQKNYSNGFALTLQPRMLEHPLHWRKPRRIFVNSMSDLFHVDVPIDYIQKVFDVMRRAHWHQHPSADKKIGTPARTKPGPRLATADLGGGQRRERRSTASNTCAGPERT